MWRHSHKLSKTQQQKNLQNLFGSDSQMSEHSKAKQKAF